ncbi:hypothetical protein B0H13DRAFT_2336220 [Mycena leptocephala]|nr:hypothetical protein B0H13DRAFT_2336220 [Mycena leptocephala]
MTICIPSAQYGPRLPDERCWIPLPGEEESTGGEMTLASLCMTTDFAAGDAHAFGWLRGGLVCPAVLASLRDLGDGGSSWTSPRSSLLSFLFGTVLHILPSRSPAEFPLQPTLYVLSLHPPTIYPCPFSAYPRSHTDKNS